MTDYFDPEIFDNPPQATLDDFVERIATDLPGPVRAARYAEHLLGAIATLTATDADPDDLMPDELEALHAAHAAIRGALHG